MCPDFWATPFNDTPHRLLCLCDLWANACDPNCCCDTLCSDCEKAAATECLPGHRVVDTGMCTQTRSSCYITSTKVNSSVCSTSTTSSCSSYTYISPSLFCVYFDNCTISDGQEWELRPAPGGLCQGGSALDLNVVAGLANITALRKRVWIGDVSVVVRLPASISAADHAPRINGNFCENALLEAHFTVHYSVSGLVTSVSVTATIGTVPITDTGVLQTFTLTHQILDQTPVPVSGNPGYVVGKPLRAGILQGSTVLEWPVPLGLPVALSAIPWDCVGGDRGAPRPTQFGLHTRAGCRLSVQGAAGGRQAACGVLLQDELLGRLLTHGGSFRVAAYGNASNAVPGDWVPVQSGTVVPCPDNLCAVDVVVTVLWTRVGSLVNSQAKVLGVMVNQLYNTATQCPSDLWLDLTSTVTFLELASPALPVTSAVPTIDARLPTDLFFPFLQNSAPPRCTLVTVMAAALALLVGVANA
ncbi:tectonic-1-like [Petromyzon marinus]|uniref:tectonic-1-like n=1 Tax=Petromyzon marinus TaxID=7757 RepID=UPI003F71185D